MEVHATSVWCVRGKKLRWNVSERWTGLHVALDGNTTVKVCGRNIWTTRTTVHNPLTSLQKVQENLPFSHGDQGCWCVLSGPRTGPSWDVFVSTHHTTSLEKVVARFANQNRHFVCDRSCSRHPKPHLPAERSRNFCKSCLRLVTLK